MGLNWAKCDQEAGVSARKSTALPYSRKLQPGRVSERVASSPLLKRCPFASKASCFWVMLTTDLADCWVGWCQPGFHFCGNSDGSCCAD